MVFAHKIVESQRSRQSDGHGSGQYGAARGERSHRGLDIVAHPRERVFSPIEGEVVREVFPYSDDLSYRGVVIRGTHDWTGYEIKMFYVEGIVSGTAGPGTLIGYAQNLGTKYPGITNHVHLEVRKDGVVVAPMEIYRMCF